MLTVVSATFACRCTLCVSEKAVSGSWCLIESYLGKWKYQHLFYTVNMLVLVRFIRQTLASREALRTTALHLARSMSANYMCNCRSRSSHFTNTTSTSTIHVTGFLLSPRYTHERQCSNCHHRPPHLLHLPPIASAVFRFSPDLSTSHQWIALSKENLESDRRGRIYTVRLR
jgi:hypothetical protein